MDKTAIKNFAVWARRKLIEDVAKNAVSYGIESQDVIEEVAYLWFNRFVALYYMEVNDYLNVGATFFLGEDNQFAPSILKKYESARIGGISKDTVKRLAKAQHEEELYRYLIIAQCNALEDVLPELFNRINGYTENLCPTNLLEEAGVIATMVNTLQVEDWKKNVEIISWLFQFYNTEPKSNAFAMLKKDQKLTKERIPEATQLFTPEWIVGYMVENSLGRFWMERKADTSLKSEMPYFLDTKDGMTFCYDESLRPEDIKLIDPCMGSGHILDYAFELFLKIYLSQGYTKEDAVRKILKHNLYGLDIDERACQLAYFIIMMKACSYDKNLLKEKIRPMFFAISDSSFMDDQLISFVAGENEEYRETLETIKVIFEKAEEVGSIIKMPKLPLDALIEHVTRMDTEYYEDLFFMMKYQLVQEKLLPLLMQAKILSDKYNIVATNPPYMAISNMDKILSDYVKKEYKDSKKDMYAVFIERCSEFLLEDGYEALITQHTWMFINSYLKLRKKLYDNYHFLHMLHLGTRAFEEISGEVVQTTTWIMRHKKESEMKPDVESNTLFIDLTGFGGKDEKEQAFLGINDTSNYIYEANVNKLRRIPGMPLAYWVDKEFASVYDRLPLESYADVTNGLFTCDNKKYLRQWYEVDYTTINFDCGSKDECIHSGAKWFPYNKGGGFRRWYGNQDYVVFFENFGEEIAEFRERRGQSKSFPGASNYFQPSISWSLVSPTKFSVRYYPKGFVFDIAGSSVFVKQECHQMPMLGILASDTIHTMMKISNPTINFQCGDVRSLPFEPELLKNEELAALVEENVRLEKDDWDSFELSWNFKRHPLAKGTSLREAFKEWEAVTKGRFDRVRANEERISQIVASAYGLSAKEEAYPEDSVTMYKADSHEEAKSFISYMVGCMLGRYSLDIGGIAFAGGLVLDNNYQSYKPLEYLDIADAVKELCKLLVAIFGEATLDDNLMFLAESISKNEVTDVSNAKVIIDKYFFNDFMKDHMKRYKKLPIYWLMQTSHKENLSVLTYMHRFNNDLLRKIGEEVVARRIDLLDSEVDDIKTERALEELFGLYRKIKEVVNEGRQKNPYISAYENLCIWSDVLKA